MPENPRRRKAIKFHALGAQLFAKLNLRLRMPNVGLTLEHLRLRSDTTILSISVRRPL